MRTYEVKINWVVTAHGGAFASGRDECRYQRDGVVTFT
jgi:hypothetical protein